jgi:hypothetical protein
MKTLKFNNGQIFIEKGKKYEENDYLFAKGIANIESRLHFTDDEGNKFKLSCEKGSLGDYRELFRIIKVRG